MWMFMDELDHGSAKVIEMNFPPVSEFCFVWVYSTPTQFRSYGAETGQMIFANSWCYIFNFKQHQG
jgi:hypothetical protein